MLVLAVGGRIVVTALSHNVGSGKTPHQILVALITATDDTVKHAGGSWAYDDKTPWATDLDGYFPQPCGTQGSDLQQYTEELYSAGVPDTVAAVTVMRKHWRELGYEVCTVYHGGEETGNVYEIVTTLPDGTTIGYIAANKVSGIQSESACFPS